MALRRSPRKTFKKRAPAKPYRKVSKKYTKKTKRTFKKGSINKKAKKSGTSHWLSYGCAIVNRTRVGFLKKLERTLPVNTYNNVSSGYVICGTGLQQAQKVANVYTPYDINAMTQSIAFTSLTGSKVILKSCEQVTLFTNQTNANAFMDIYDIIARRDIGTVQSYDPFNAWATDPNGSGYGNYGATPFESPQFCAFYKVARITRVNLGQGETHEHITRHRPQKVFNTDLSDITTLIDKGAWRGLTHYTMVIVKGSPADAINTTVTTTLDKIDFVTTKKYAFEMVSNAASTVAYIGTLGNVSTEDVMNPATGAAIVVQSA